MRFLQAALAFLLLPLICTPAIAVDYAEHVSGNGPVTIDPTKAYIAFRILQKSEFRFERLPSDEEIAQYDRDRQAAFDDYRKKKPKGNDFEFDPLEARFSVNTQFGKIFDKQDGQYVYLIAVKPGTYALYGHMWQDGPGDMATCFCMGTVKFEAAAGKVTDLGRIRMPDDWDVPAPPANPAGILPFVLIPPATPLRPAGRLQGLPVEPAVLHAMDKMPNAFGVVIDRLFPIPGVLAYERDKVVDPKSTARSR